MSNLSFEQIRKQVQINAGAVAEQAEAAKNKVVEAAKSVGAVAKTVGKAVQEVAPVVHGYLPVTNNKLERELEALRMDIARLSAQQSLDLAYLRTTLGLPAPIMDQKSIDAVAGVLVSAMKIEKTAANAKKELQPAQEAPVAPQGSEPSDSTSEIMELTERERELAEAILREDTETIAKIMDAFDEEKRSAPTNPPLNGVNVSTPTNWHMGIPNV